MTGLAGILDDLALTAAGGAGALDGEKALLRANLAHARTGRAGDRLGRTLGPGALAFAAGDRAGNPDGLLQTAIGLFQRNAQIIAQILPALRARPAAARATTAHHVAEQILEHIGEGRAEIARMGPATTTETAAAIFKGGMAKAVISGLLLVVLQAVIGFVDFLEACLGVLVVLIAVGVKLFRLAAVSLLDFVWRGTAGHTQHLVIATLGHVVSCSPAP